MEITIAELKGVVDALAAPEDVLALRASPALQVRLDELLERNQAAGLSPEEMQEWERYCEVEHLVRLAKLRTALALAGK